MRLAYLTPIVALAACSATSSAGTPAAPHTPNQHNIRLAQRATHYLHQNFRGTTWLPDIKRVKVRAGQLFVVTDIYPDSDADAPTRSICAAFLAWPPAPSTVHVVSSTGKWTGC